uniref:N-terminal acetyltransferase A complex subunit NAT1 n=1 Tax=Lygus hesperus TaxID=30085 RepID=A0A0A9Z6Q7_LYGHE
MTGTRSRFRASPVTPTTKNVSCRESLESCESHFPFQSSWQSSGLIFFSLSQFIYCNKMPPKKWSDELNMKFVQVYKECECLWNQFDPLYKNKFARESALQKIAEEMNLDDFGVPEAKAKIKSLRSTYNLELDKQRKSEKSGTGSEDVYVPSIKWFGTMQDVMSKGTLKRPTQSNLVSRSNILTKQ